MNFLFHTIIEYNRAAVYYNIHRNDQHYFAEILSNPSQIPGVSDFELYNNNGEWHSSILLPGNYLNILAEEIDSHTKQKNQNNISP